MFKPPSNSGCTQAILYKKKMYVFYSYMRAMPERRLPLTHTRARSYSRSPMRAKGKRYTHRQSGNAHNSTTKCIHVEDTPLTAHNDSQWNANGSTFGHASELTHALQRYRFDGATNFIMFSLYLFHFFGKLISIGNCVRRIRHRNLMQ